MTVSNLFTGVYGTSWYFCSGSAEYTADDGASKESDRFGTAPFFRSSCHTCFFSICNDTGMKKKKSYYILKCVFKTQPTSAFINAFTKFTLQFPKCSRS